MSDSQQRGAVLVTGATGGIGAATVRVLAGRGHTVYAGVRSGSLSGAQRDGVFAGVDGVRVVALDVADPGSVAAAAKRIGDEVGGLRAVVNNAGVIVQGPLELVPPDELRRGFEVNTLGPASVVRAFLPLIRAGSGRIVNITAPTGRIAVPLLTALSASKAGLESFSNGLRMELAAWKIPVVVIEPGLTATAIFDKAAEAEKDAHDRAAPELVALYRGHLEAAEQAAARQQPDPIDKVAETIVRAVESARPKRRYVVGNARAMSLLNHLPARLRDRLVVTAFGLGKVEAG